MCQLVEEICMRSLGSQLMSWQMSADFENQLDQLEVVLCEKWIRMNVGQLKQTNVRNWSELCPKSFPWLPDGLNTIKG